MKKRKRGVLLELNREFEGIENQTDSSPLVLVREKGLLSDGGKLGWRINERISRYDGSNVFSLILEEKSRDETLLKKGLLLLKTHGWRYIYIYVIYVCNVDPPTFNILSSNRCSDIKRTSLGAGYVHPRIMWPCLTINFQRYPPATSFFPFSRLPYRISWTRRLLEFFSSFDLRFIRYSVGCWGGGKRRKQNCTRGTRISDNSA